jgi:hypothetical protein
MHESLVIEPFGFFTLEALKAGWYLIWRQLVRVVPVAIGGLLIGGLLGKLGLAVVAAVIMGLGFCVAAVWAALLVPRLASRWAAVTYGYPLTGEVRVWWGIVWRVSVVSLVASVMLTPPNLVALSLSSSFPGGVLGGVGKLLTALLGLVSVGVSVLSTGWAMSKVSALQLTGMPISPPYQPPVVMSEPRMAPPIQPVAVGVPPVPKPVAMRSPAAVPAPAMVSAAPVLAPPAGRAPAAAEGRRQCPKCGLHETEHGTIIGWYCTICGWRESRRT